jgi:hypothetical protein
MMKRRIQYGRNWYIDNIISNNSSITRAKTTGGKKRAATPISPKSLGLKANRKKTFLSKET